ncbi:MAG: aminomethyl-transferring glycine dehydrogenase subunit GcvPA [Dehalococcoidia bacterium]|nr:aminomethyl-transferring glycine dehydrogenase subunit GcvPA [Dehalococcoidia bacterium]
MSRNPYVPNTEEDRRAMLRVIGARSVDELFDDIPAQHRDPPLDLPPPLSEIELRRELSTLAARNRPAGEMPCFLGAGSYRHFIPAVVNHIISRGEFATPYTPYQPEVSQGTLQTIFEFQSLVCELTGMEVANAGMYDGASALAEACLMAASIAGRDRIALLSTAHPHCQDVVRTYAAGRGLGVDVMEPEAVALEGGHACLAVQQPNFFGYLEDARSLGEAARANGSLYVVAVDPISLGLFRPPGDYGADIVVAEGQPLGIPMSFGGPYVGLFATRERYLRRMPGRIVGRTRDSEGRTGYVLTLQAREQHIRRERATSNISSNEQLAALAVTVYLCALGPQGLRRVAEHCYRKSQFAAAAIASLPGYSLPLRGTFFKEFVVRCPRPPQTINAALLERGIIGGLDVSHRIENGMLLCVTEMNTRGEIDSLVAALEEIGR